MTVSTLEPATIHHGASILDLEQFEEHLDVAGRVDGPAILLDAWFGKQISAETLAAVVGRVWQMAEYPDSCLPHTVWRHLFAAAGFTVDGVPAERPPGPIELWRGTVPQRRRDWSWTTDRAVAETFAFGHVRRRPTGRLYRVLAPAHALLCANTERDEAEYVVDTRGLRITEAGR
jgi:hypothetical protein